MFIKILGIFAEFERENLVERLQAAFERKAKEGYSNCLCTPSYGYKRDLGAKVQDIVPEEAAIVREIYNLFLHDDYTMTQIATMLNLRKVPSKKGLLWNSKTVRLILTNVNYIGQVRYSVNNKDKYFEADGKHEAIIDEKTFYAVRHKLNMRKGASHIKSCLLYTSLGGSTSPLSSPCTIITPPIILVEVPHDVVWQYSSLPSRLR